MGESGFLIPASYANSPSPDDAQLVHLANAASDDIREHGLTGARRFASIPLGGSGSYNLPADFHAYVSDTAWVGSRQVDFPVTPQTWAELNATGVEFYQPRVRLINAVKMLGDVSGETLKFEYISKYPWQDASANAIENATSDSDVWLLDTRLIVLGTKWRWKKEKGVEDWQIDREMYMRHLSHVMGRDGGAGAICFGEPVANQTPPYNNLWVT